MGSIEFTSAGATARQDIIDNYSWTITDGGTSELTLSYNVTYGGVINEVSTLTQNQINNIVQQTPTLVLTKRSSPNTIESNTNITSNTTLTQVGEPFVGVFTSNFTAADLLDILLDDAYYTISGGDGYGSNYGTLSPYFNGSNGSYYLHWNESTGKFYSAGATSSGGSLSFVNYVLGDALYNEIDPLIDVIGFSANPPKSK